MVQRQAIKQPVQLPRRDWKGQAGPKVRPIEQPFFQSAVVEPEAIVIPE
ncbi:hypothetical protein B481_1047 [Planococcus halocryophilus Or1]|nr:hypothetical protein B481_1047 [Planococcus halocryophilus Or1]